MGPFGLLKLALNWFIPQYVAAVNTRITHTFCSLFVPRLCLFGLSPLITHTTRGTFHENWFYTATKLKEHTLAHIFPPHVCRSEHVVFVFVFILIFNSHCWPTFSVCVGEAWYFLLLLAFGPQVFGKIKEILPGPIIYSFTAKKLINPGATNLWKFPMNNLRCV